MDNNNNDVVTNDDDVDNKELTAKHQEVENDRDEVSFNGDKGDDKSNNDTMTNVDNDTISHVDNETPNINTEPSSNTDEPQQNEIEKINNGTNCVTTILIKSDSSERGEVVESDISPICDKDSELNTEQDSISNCEFSVIDTNDIDSSIDNSRIEVNEDKNCENILNSNDTDQKTIHDPFNIGNIKNDIGVTFVVTSQDVVIGDGDDNNNNVDDNIVC